MPRSFNRNYSIIFVLIVSLLFGLSACGSKVETSVVYQKVTTFSGFHRDDSGDVFKEPFGLAFSPGGVLHVSDGEAGKIWKAEKDGNLTLVSTKVDTPSAIAFDKDGMLYVADSGSHTIKKIDVVKDTAIIVAGVENKFGFADGDAALALFNAPIGIAVDETGRVIVADTYNDRIRVIENGRVTTIAGSTKGFADADGAQAKFDTPCGVTVGEDGAILVADTGNRRIRSIDRGGKVTTVAGGGTFYSGAILPLLTAFTEPMDVKIDKQGTMYVADAGENNVYAIGPKVFPLAEKMAQGRRGIVDGTLSEARFNRPSGLAIDANGHLFVADSDNQLLRVVQNSAGTLGTEIKTEEIVAMRQTAEKMRAAAEPRWPYEPPLRTREIAGTMGEARGEIIDGEDSWFHNGLDVVGGYGETARFVRTEKNLRPLTAQLFGTLRENLRLPTLGYIHIRLGRDQTDRPFDDPRFIFGYDENKKMNGLRIRRGTKFQAGDPIGTLNAMNHVHLIAGRSGNEINAIAALELPGIGDAIAPVIENVWLFDEDKNAVGETQKGNSRINVSGKVRIVAKAYDRMDGNAERRRLGIFKTGYQLLNEDGSPVAGFEKPAETIIFDKLPEDGNAAVRFVYFNGSKSGATGETIFNYNVTNFVQNGAAREEFFDTGKFSPGNYTLKVFVWDYFGNQASKDMQISISR